MTLVQQQYRYLGGKLRQMRTTITFGGDPVEVERGSEYVDAPAETACSAAAVLPPVDTGSAGSAETTAAAEPQQFAAQPLGLAEGEPEVPKVPRVGPAMIRGIKTTLFAFVSTIGVVFAAVREQLADLPDLTWKVLVVVLASALLAGAIYFVDHLLRPNSKW